MTKHPNFFIAGAPKCGTTAMFAYLSEHPQIYMVPEWCKEPHFFASDMGRFRYTDNLDKYLKLFDGVTDQHRAIGEASVMYLYSDDALENIKAYNPDARILIMLRNPLSAAPSQHAQLVATMDEDQEEFSDAWDKEASRRQGENIPYSTRCVKHLFYRDVYSYAPQLEKLWSIFDREQTHVLLFDDFVSDTRGAYEHVLQWLGVDDDGRTEFLPVNEATAPKHRGLAKFMTNPPAPIAKAARGLKRVLKVEDLGIRRATERLNQQPMKRAELSADMIATMKTAYEADIRACERLLERDLEHWLA